MSEPYKLDDAFASRHPHPNAPLLAPHAVNITTLRRWARAGWVARAGETWVLTSPGAELLGWKKPKLKWWQKLLMWITGHWHRA